MTFVMATSVKLGVTTLVDVELLVSFMLFNMQLIASILGEITVAVQNMVLLDELHQYLQTAIV